MLQQESIYNLVPKAKIAPENPPLYYSHHPHYTAPTASTFLLKTTSFPDVANMNGNILFPRGAHPLHGENATFGRPLGGYKVNPSNFIKKGHQYKILPLPEKLHLPTEIRKPAIPSLADKPIMGLKSGKNYILSNAVDVILMQPKTTKSQSIDYLNKRNYGKIPSYISKLRLEVEGEYKQFREMQLRNEEDEKKKQRVLTEAETEALREGLKRKWEMYNYSYGKLSHKKKCDNLVIIRK